LIRRFDLDANTAGPPIVISHDSAFASSSLGAIYSVTPNEVSSVLAFEFRFLLAAGKYENLQD